MKKQVLALIVLVSFAGALRAKEETTVEKNIRHAKVGINISVAVALLGIEGFLIRETIKNPSSTNIALLALNTVANIGSSALAAESAIQDFIK